MTHNGKTGYVTITVRGNQGPGEVQVGNSRLVAWSDEPIRVGSQVVVTAERGTRTVTVSPTGL